MISLGVRVRHELRDSVLKRGPSEEDHSVQALRFYRAHEALGESVQIRRSWRQANDTPARPGDNPPECVRVFCVPIHNEVPRISKKAIMGIGDIARDLCHPGVVRMWGNTRDVDLSRREIDEEEEVVRDQPLERQDLHAQEVGRRQTLPVGFQKR